MRSRAGVPSHDTSMMQIEIDNSAAERALRAVALGRKNYLFCGSDGGGESAAAIYTLLGTARLNGVDQERWLREVLARTADHPLSRDDGKTPPHTKGRPPP